MAPSGVRSLVLSDEEVDLIATLLEEFADGADELASDIAVDELFLPVGEFDDIFKGMSTMLEITQSVYTDKDRARRLVRMFRQGADSE